MKLFLSAPSHKTINLLLVLCGWLRVEGIIINKNCFQIAAKIRAFIIKTSDHKSLCKSNSSAYGLQVSDYHQFTNPFASAVNFDVVVSLG